MLQIEVNAMGDTCPIPIVKTKNAIRTMKEPGQVTVLVDNEIAVQNLEKMARQKGYPSQAAQLGEGRYQVVLTIAQPKQTEGSVQEPEEEPECEDCRPNRKTTVVVISSDKMGSGNEELGAVLMKGFLYAVSMQDELPQTILFYNGGAKMSCEGSPALEDLRAMEEQGVEILTCGTCLDYYGLKEKLAVGGVTNMYAIVEKMTGADRLVRP